MGPPAYRWGILDALVPKEPDYRFSWSPLATDQGPGPQNYRSSCQPETVTSLYHPITIGRPKIRKGYSILLVQPPLYEGEEGCYNVILVTLGPGWAWVSAIHTEPGSEGSQPTPHLALRSYSLCRACLQNVTSTHLSGPLSPPAPTQSLLP